MDLCGWELSSGCFCDVHGGYRRKDLKGRRLCQTASVVRIVASKSTRYCVLLGVDGQGYGLLSVLRKTFVADGPFTIDCIRAEARIGRRDPFLELGHGLGEGMWLRELI